LTPWGAKKKITQTIIDAQADYVIQVKDNQKQLRENIALFFQEPVNGPFDTFETVDGEHGRIETRRYFTTNDIGWLPGKNEWPGINTICMAVREREVNGQASTEASFFISSLANQAPAIAKAIREHWVSKTTCTAAWI
jgi:predicted transposase YbfD/YdcC